MPWNRLQSWLERHCGQADVFALEPIGRSGPAFVDQGLQNRQPSAARSDPTEWIERQSAASKNKGIAAGGPGLRAGSGLEISARERLIPKRAGTVLNLMSGFTEDELRAVRALLFGLAVRISDKYGAQMRHDCRERKSS